MWSAALLAALFAAWRRWRLLSARVNTAIANDVLIKLLRAGNLDRARKLCAAAPRSVYLGAVSAALAAPEDPRPAFEDAFARAIAPHQASRWMDLVAMVAGLVAVVIAATAARIAPPVLIVGGAAAALAALNLRAMRRLRREAEDGLPALIDALLARSRPVVPRPPSDDAAVEPEPGGVLYLVASEGGDEIGRVPLDREVIKIGRLASSHLCIDHPSVSRMHAVIETTPEGSTLIDLGSGTRINGAPVNKAVLADGDEIQIGDIIVRVTSGPGQPVTRPAPRRETAPPISTLDLRSGTCPLCRGRTIAKRPAVAGDLIPWVCESCGYAQLFAPR